MLEQELETVTRRSPKIGRNDPCFCGSGKKYKKCCYGQDPISPIEGLIREGYELQKGKDDQAAIDKWWEAWQLLREVFTPEINSTEALERALGTDLMLDNWTSDFEMALDGDELTIPRYQEIGIQYLTEVLSQFTKQHHSNQEHRKSKLAEIYFAKGDETQAEEIFERMIMDSPHRSAGYIGWSHCLTWGRKRFGKEQDTRRALGILEKAKAHPVEDGEDWDLENRIEDLKAQLDPAHENSQ